MFEGLKVIELAGVMAGPMVGNFFSELGAQVVKIENPKTGGDVTRQWKLPVESADSPSSAYFASVNWGKQHLFLDLNDSEDAQHLRTMIAESDVLICNWKKGDAEKFGLTYQTVRQINPLLIYGNITGFGEADERVAFDVVLQAETGWMFMNGTPDSGPVKMPVAVIDQLAAHQLKEGILIALMQRMNNGKGACVTVSLYDAGIAALANQASNYLNTGTVPQRNGSLHPNIAPYGELLRTKDGVHIVLAVGSDKQFRSLCKILHADALAQDPMFQKNTDRVQNRVVLLPLLREKALAFNAVEFLQLCKRDQIPAGEVKSLKDVFDQRQASELILRDAIGARVKSVVFHLES